jgi:methionyl-tRNA formyltransferase
MDKNLSPLISDNYHEGFTDSYILVGSDFEFGLACVRAILENEIPVSAIGGLTAERIVAATSLKIKNPKLLIVNTDKPWEESRFLEATCGTSKIGISCGLETIVPVEFLENRFCINTHPSALPYNKGSHQSFWAIMDETKGGGTLHVMTKKIDDGPILFQDVFEIPEHMISRDLQIKQLSTCIELLQKNIKNIFLGNFSSKPQVGGRTHYKRDIIEASTLLIDESIEVSELFKLVRATCNKGNGFWIQTQNVRYRIIVSNVESVDLDL